MRRQLKDLNIIDNFMLYTIKNQCIENHDMDYNDGATTLFLYAKGTKSIPSQRVADMLNFIIESTEENARKANLSNIQKMINQIKSDDGMEEKFIENGGTKEQAIHLLDATQEELDAVIVQL